MTRTTTALRLIALLSIALAAIHAAAAQDPAPPESFDPDDIRTTLAALESKMAETAQKLGLRTYDGGPASAERQDPVHFLPPPGEEASYPAVLQGRYDDGLFRGGDANAPVDILVTRFRSLPLAGVSLGVQAGNVEGDPGVRKLDDLSALPRRVRVAGDERIVYERRPDGHFMGGQYVGNVGYVLLWRWDRWVVRVECSSAVAVPLTDEESLARLRNQDIDRTRFDAAEEEALADLRRFLGEAWQQLDNTVRTTEELLGAQPTIELDRDEAARGGIIKVRGAGYEPAAAVKIYIGGSDYFAARQTERGGSFEGWIWVPDEVPFGEHDVWAETVGGDDRSNTVRLSVAPVELGQQVRRLDELIQRYRAAVPQNDRWYGTDGAVNNITYLVGSAGGGAIYAATAVLTLGQSPKSVFPDGAFLCSSYQALTLRFLDDIRWNDDPDVRSLLDGFDHGPFTSGPAKVKWLSHFFTVVWPHSAAFTDEQLQLFGGEATWRNAGLCFDPWPKQKPWVWELSSGTAHWAFGSSYSSQWTTASRTFIAPTPEAFGNYRNMYPVTGAPFYVDRAERRVVPEFAVGNEPAQSLSVHSPVRLEILGPGGAAATAIDGLELFTVRKPEGGDAWFAALPAGRYEVKVIGTGDGAFRLRTKQRGAAIQEYPSVAVRAGEVATIIIDDARPTTPLVTADGRTLTPTPLDRPTVADPGAFDGSSGAAGVASGSAGGSDDASSDRPRGGAVASTDSPGPPVGFGDDDRIVGTDRGDGDDGPAVAAGGTGGGDGDAGSGDRGVMPDGSSASVTAPISGPSRTRTIVYRQLTTFDDEITGVHGSPLISDDGRRIAFVASDRPHGIYLMSADGSGLTKLEDADSGTVEFDVSGDGGRVAWTDRSRIRVVPGDGSGAGGRDLYRNASGRIRGLRISANGAHVVYAITSGTDRGVYRIGADGRGRRRIAGPADVADAIGVREQDVDSFYSNGPALDVSADGDRIVFAARNAAYGITPAGTGVYTVRGDGTSLRRIVGELQWVHGVGISGNGRRIGYLVNRRGEEKYAGASDVDGTDQRVVAEQAPLVYPGQGVMGGPIPVSHDGTTMLLSLQTLLFDTHGGGATSLGTPSGSGSVHHHAMDRRWSSADMRRHVYVMRDRDGHYQIGLAEIEPAHLGAAPRIERAELWPPEVVRGASEPMTIAADVTVDPRTRLVHVTSSFCKDGVLVSGMRHDPLLDDGARDDGAAGDGRYGLNSIMFSKSMATGPYTVRIKAEARDAENRQHATVVEFGTVEVIDLD